jgi:hypothetical protein
MDAFSYLSVLLSIILGLAITQILQGVRDLMRARARLRVYWPSLWWAGLLLLICVQEWWAMFSWRTYQLWTFQGFAVMLAQTIATYLAAALVLPEFQDAEPVDLRAYYYANHRWFFAMLALAVAISIAKDAVLIGSLPTLLNFSAQLAFIGMAVLGSVSGNERVHKALAPAAALLFSAYIAVLFAKLR